MGTQGFFNFGQAANNAAAVGGRAAASAIANVGGRAVSVPVSMRYAANAATYALAALRLNPAWLIAGTAASFALAYGLEYLDDQWQKHDTQEFTGTIYRGGWSGYVGDWFSSPQLAASGLLEVLPTTHSWSDCTGTQTHALLSVGPASFTFQTTRTPCVNSIGVSGGGGVSNYTGSIGTSTGTVVEPILRPAVDGDFVAPPGDPIPDGLPEVLPAPLPVELPDVNPSPAPDYLPQPLRVPLGDPVAVPGTDPQEYKQPVADIVPKGKPTDPWLIDLQPKDVVGTDPEGLQDPATPDPGAATTPEEQEQLCSEFPNISACKELGTPEDADLGTDERSITWAPEAGFGANDAACPAPKVLALALVGNVELSYQPVCDYAAALRFIVIALAALAGAAIFVSGTREL